MQLFCRLLQKRVNISKSDTLHSGFFNQVDDLTAQGVVFSGLASSELNFYPKEVKTADQIKTLEKKLEIVFDGIKDILNKYSDTSRTGFSHLLSSEINNEIQPNDLDGLIEEAFESGLFFTISQQPRMSMRYDVDLLPISRVKRYANNYQAHLVAHSECWQQRTFTGIVPKKLQAKISEDEYVIYENVVYARLLDHLQRYLYGLSVKLHEVTSFFEKYSVFDGSNRDFRYRHSVSIDWGLAFGEAELNDVNSNTHTLLQDIERYQALIMQLKSMSLYRMIPVRKNVPIQLKQTNILMHDKYYRRIANIWRYWLVHSREDRLSPDSLAKKKVLDAEQYASYVYRVILRCLDEAGFVNQGLIDCYRHPSGLELYLKEQSAGVWDLYVNDTQALRFVAVSEVVFGEVILPVKTIVVAADVDNNDQLGVFKLSPLTIEGRASVTAELIKKLWSAVLVYYKTPISGRLPGPVEEKVSGTVGYYFQDNYLEELKKVCNKDLYSEIQAKARVANFIRYCPCCHTRTSDQFIRHSEKKAFKATCINSDCNTEWFFDLEPTIYFAVNKEIQDSGRFGFVLNL